MRNLKKVLALVLTLAMMLSVMVMNAGAFTDDADIDSVHNEAVDMCVALKIINGYTDGSFQPNGDVTRAEMCKMICVAMNGGKAPMVSASATPTFSDVPTTHWAVGYIESCAAQGIVAGMGNGTFEPDGKVTGTQAAKMLLIALGYDAQTEGFVGSSWDVNVNVKATQKGLYENLADCSKPVDLTQPLSREHAAEMIWNALQADEVEYSYVLSTGPDGSLVSTPTVKDKENKAGAKVEALSDWYGTKDTDTTCGIMTAIKYNTSKDEWTYTVQKLDEATHTLGAAQTYTSDQDFTDLLGHNVTFVVKDNTAKDVYGAFNDESTVLVSGVIGDIDFDDVNSKLTAEVDDVDYDLDPALTAIEFRAVNHSTLPFTSTRLQAIVSSGKVVGLENANNDAMLSYFEFSAIDWDDDGDVDVVIVYPTMFGKVAYVSSDYVRVTAEAGAYAYGALVSGQFDTDADDNEFVLYDGAAKDDYAVVGYDSTLVNDGVITMVEKQNATLAKVSGDDVTFDGTVYDQSTLATKYTSSSLDDDIEFYAVNGYVVKADKDTDVEMDKLVLVTASPVQQANGYYDVAVLFSDGSEDVVTLKTRNSDADTAGNSVIADTLYTYETSSGKYKLTLVDKDTFDFDNYADSNGSYKVWTGVGTTYEKGNSSGNKDYAVYNDGTTNYKFADDAVVFMNDGTDWAVITGAAASKVTTSISSTYYVGAEENDNGYTYVTMAVITSSNYKTAGDTEYGFVVSNVDYSNNADGDPIGTFQVWNGTEYVELTADESDIPDGTSSSDLLAKQSIISYKIDSEGMATDIAVLNDTSDTSNNATLGAVVAFDNVSAKDLVFAYATGDDDLKLDADDSTVLFIDYGDKTGEVHDFADIIVADEADVSTAAADKVPYNGKDYFVNAYAIYNASGDVDLLVIDLSNDMNNVR